MKGWRDFLRIICASVDVKVSVIIAAELSEEDKREIMRNKYRLKGGTFVLRRMIRHVKKNRYRGS